MTGCVKRRSTFTTTVLSCLSLTTTPCKTRFGICSSSSLRLSRHLAAQRLHTGLPSCLRGSRVPSSLCLSRLLAAQRLHTRDVPADLSHAPGVLELTRGALKAQVELLLLQIEQLVLKLV